MSTILKALKRLEEDAPTPEDTAISSGSAPSRPPASTREGRSAPLASSASHPSGGNPETIPATDPRATENLRQRILAEEAAAQSSEVARVSESEGSLTTFFSRRPVQIVAAIVLGLGFGLIGYGLSSRTPASDTQFAQTAQRPLSTQAGTQPSAPPPSPSEFAASDPSPSASVAPAPSNAASYRPPGSASADPRAAAAPSAPSPSVAVAAAPRVRAERRPESAIPLAAVAPTPAVRAAESAPKAPPAPVAPAPRRVASAPTKLKPTNTRPPPPAPAAASRPRPTERERAPSVVSARAATPSREDARSQARSIPAAESRPVPRSQPAPERVFGNARPAAGRSTPPPSRAAARPATRKAAQDVERIDDRPRVPDISVVRTAWHPRADRRSARVRLESTREVMTLAEGDAIGGLIVQEITPSAVLFRAGEVEIRRRVGSPGR